VFHQFAFAPGACEPGAEVPVATLTTVQNDWSAPARGESVHDWARDALPEARSSHYGAQFLYAAPHAVDARAGRFFWLGESGRAASDLDALWQSRARSGPVPLGRPVPIFPPPDGDPGPDTALSDTSGAGWVTHWVPVGSR